MTSTGAPRSKHLRRLLDSAVVIPVVTLSDPDCAVPVAAALARGGLTVMEVALRSACALEAIERIRAGVAGVVVGAGTLTAPAQLAAASAAGAQFLVSPGSTDALLDAADASEVPFLPGVATPSEAMRLGARGYTELKFFPAEASGGVAFLRALAAALPQLSFCPTGGVDAGNASAYLACANVCCVAGTWLTPAQALAQHDWGRIESLARTAAGLAAHTP